MKRPKNWAALGLIGGLSLAWSGVSNMLLASGSSPGGRTGTAGGGSGVPGQSAGGSNAGGASSVMTPGGTTPAHLTATNMPALPPGTSNTVRQAVQASFDAEALTMGQAAAVSRLSAPMYFPEVFQPIGNTAQARADAQEAQRLSSLTAEQILAGVGNQGTTAGPSNSVVDFGSEAAAKAALDDYWNNFVGGRPPGR